jgi:hypothetical protein
MIFQLTIDCDNAAFEDCAGEEIARILHTVAKRVEHNDASVIRERSPISLYDLNGNLVGEASLTMTAAEEAASDE